MLNVTKMQQNAKKQSKTKSFDDANDSKSTISLLKFCQYTHLNKNVIRFGAL